MTRLRVYDIWLPDGRLLGFDPGPPPVYRLEGEAISEDRATEVWEEQDATWQRGRTLEQAIRAWEDRLS